MKNILITAVLSTLLFVVVVGSILLSAIWLTFNVGSPWDNIPVFLIVMAVGWSIGYYGFQPLAEAIYYRYTDRKQQK